MQTERAILLTGDDAGAEIKVLTQCLFKEIDMKLRNKGLAAALTAALGLGFTGQASADVYGLSTLKIDNLRILFGNVGDADPGLYTFSTNADASLNGTADASDGSASCGGVFPGTNCSAGTPRLSGTVQNAPGGDLLRGENDYTIYGTGAQYSNAEAAIIQAALLGDPNPLDPVTQTAQIAESNLVTGTSAQANTLVQSNTLLEITFTLVGGQLIVNFDAMIDVLSEVTPPDIGSGLAQANSSLTVNLQSGGVQLLSWAPNGNNFVTTCNAGACTATETGPSLNNTTSSGGAADRVNGSGNYNMLVTGLADGQYTLALAATTSTDLIRIPVPVPGTLFLMGAGLLLGTRSLRSKQRA